MIDAERKTSQQSLFRWAVEHVEKRFYGNLGIVGCCGACKLFAVGRRGREKVSSGERSSILVVVGCVASFRLQDSRKGDTALSRLPVHCP